MIIDVLIMKIMVNILVNIIIIVRYKIMIILAIGSVCEALDSGEALYNYLL